jgi:hypothetical protein
MQPLATGEKRHWWQNKFTNDAKDTLVLNTLVPKVSDVLSARRKSNFDNAKRA